MAVPRVVLDTNVVLSALVFAQGRPASLRHAWQDQRCVPLASRITTEELMRVLAYPKFRLTAAEQQELLADYLPYCASVRVPAKSPPMPVSRDPFDVPLLALAAAGNADYLVTGDHDLLGLSPKMTCPIVTPDTFLALPASA